MRRGRRCRRVVGAGEVLAAEDGAEEGAFDGAVAAGGADEGVGAVGVLDVDEEGGVVAGLDA